ncbi:MAG: di-heme-cytochrome C peroxidase, partial [Gammaproteobacteria bacterium]
KAFSRFSALVLPKVTEKKAAKLKAEFSALEASIKGDAEIRKPHRESGYGRVDALTQILNALSVTHQQWPDNLRSIDAPTSYPFLWLAPQLEFVQWNPIASSPISRNGGEVLGVFGKANLYSSDEKRYSSTLLISELAALEKWLEELNPPAWDETLLGKIDYTRAESGQALYKEYCVECHSVAPYAMTDPKDNAFGKTFIKIGRVDYKDVGTDPLYIEGLLTRLVTTRATLDQKQSVEPALQFFLDSVGAILTRAMDDANLSDEAKIALNGFRFRPSVDGKPPEIYSPSSFTDLKASPIAGAWATAPYLHNGSVPTLYELLSPESERRRVFWTGSRELDLDRIGFVSDNAPGRFRFDTTLLGNHNTGHNYPAQGLDHEQRLDVIEYIKTLH